MAAASAGPDGATQIYGLLQGTTVVEAASFIAGPSCGLHLAQMGATVIRLDQIGGGPDAGRWPLSPGGASLYWEGLNKGKKSVAINLADPAGRALAQRIAVAADGLFVTNFPERGFLSYEALSALRPDLVCLRVMGWADGQQAVDYTINAAAGVPLMTGHPDDARPVNHVLPAWDLLAGAYGAFALLAARQDRARTGQGREVRLALSDLAAATLANLGAVAETLHGGDRPRTGNDLFGAFGRDFVTREGERLMIVAITPRQWSGLVAALQIGAEVQALEAARGISFATDEGLRHVHRDVLVPLVAKATAGRNADELALVFAEHGVCWSRYHTLAGALACEPRLFAENPIFAIVDHPSGAYPTPGAPARLPQDDRQDAHSAPRLGENTEEVLTTLLGMAAGECARLRDGGVVA